VSWVARLDPSAESCARNPQHASNALAYRATNAQWLAERRASNVQSLQSPGTATWRKYSQERLSGQVFTRPTGDVVGLLQAGSAAGTLVGRSGPLWATSWSTEADLKPAP